MDDTDILNRLAGVVRDGDELIRGFECNRGRLRTGGAEAPASDIEVFEHADKSQPAAIRPAWRDRARKRQSHGCPPELG